MDLGWGKFGADATTDSTDDLFKAQAHVWNHTFNFINSMSLKCAIQLGIPDAIHRHGRPITLPELAAALPAVHPSKAGGLARLMRLLVLSGFFAKTSGGDGSHEEAFSLTLASRLLLRDSSGSMASFVLGVLDPIMTDPRHFLGAWFGSPDATTPFELAHGKPIWELARAEPRLNQLINDAMAGDSQVVARVLVGEHKRVFEGVMSLVDVGGGTGTLAKAVAAAIPEIHCTVLDLPHVVDGLQGSKNLCYVRGDMFEAIPPADAVLLKWVLCDWSDEECSRILTRCKEAVSGSPRGGKVMIIDLLVGNNPWTNEGTDNQHRPNHEFVETELLFDLQMMAIVTGKERNEKEWAKLFSDVGFSDYKILPILGLRVLIEAYP